MSLALRRQLRVYGAFAAMGTKMVLAYNIWVWTNYFVQVVALIIFVFFWRAVYANTLTISGLNLSQTLNYILLARLLSPLTSNTNAIYQFGQLIREGQMTIELLRPADFQAASFFNNLGELTAALVLQLPLFVLAWVIFGLSLPTSGLVWVAFIVSALLGFSILFFFDWMLGCAAFYLTEIWGLSVLRYSIATFFSGLLLPLVMLPDWLQQLALALPFAQALYVPVSILSGLSDIADVPRIWLIQVGWLLTLGVLSRLIFRQAVRKITVQGG